MCGFIFFLYGGKSGDRKIIDIFINTVAGIKCNVKETLSIKLSDGLYDEANPYYLKVFDHTRSLQNHLPHIIHWADIMSTMAEYDEWEQSLEKEKVEVKQRVKNIKDAVSGNGRNKDLFDELFGDKK